MTLQHIGPAIEELKRWSGFSPAELIPATPEEIVALEAFLSAPYRLPGAYRELLQVGGRKLAKVYSGVDFSYRMAWVLLSNGYRDILRMLRPYNRDAVMPPELFVVNEHLGSNFTYVKLDEGDDPPVYWWEEGEGGLETSMKEHDSFSQFVLEQVRKSIRHRGG